MDAIDNLVYSTLNVCHYPNLFVSETIGSDFEKIGIDEPDETFQPPGGTAITINGGSYPTLFNGETGITSYHEATRLQFTTLDNTHVIADALTKHWFDIANRVSYTTGIGEVDKSGFDFPIFNPTNPATPEQAYVKFNTPPYHLRG